MALAVRYSDTTVERLRIVSELLTIRKMASSERASANQLAPNGHSRYWFPGDQIDDFGVACIFERMLRERV